MEDKQTTQEERMLKALELMASSVDTSESVDELAGLVSELIVFVQKNNTDLASGFENLRLMFAQAQKDLDSNNSLEINQVKAQLIAEIKNQLEKVRGKDGKDGNDYKLTDKDKEEIASKIEVPVVEKIVETVIKEKNETPEETANRLNTKEEIIEQETIKGLIKRFEDLEKKISKKSTTAIIGGATGGGKVVKVHDLSDSLNGVLKTFALPAFWRVLSVNSTSDPKVFRQTVDYTTDASAMTITFTDEIDAGTTLSAGQTLLVLYSEA